MNEFDTSESNILSVASNQRILHEFLYSDITASPKVYNARRTKMSLSYLVGSEQIRTTNLQMEIDLTLEHEGIVTVVEGKNGFPPDFAIYQLFHPFLYYWTLRAENALPISAITCCYVLRKRDDANSTLRLYLYTFQDPQRMDSIILMKKAQFNLIRR